MNAPVDRPCESALFFARAEQEAGRYGSDPWVFLREIVQNSRDARARHIDITVRVTDADEEITCEDDGGGMTGEIVERYLIRLYASTKTNDGSVGYFGVGFWSILRFEPRVVTVTTRSGKETVGLRIDCRTHTVSTTPATLDHAGTRVTLLRDAGSGPRPPGDLRALVRERLLLYAAHVRPFRNDPPVALRLDGERLNRRFPDPPHGSRRFAGKGFDAVVGFGPKPRVCVYTEGILVRAMTSLDEVIPSRQVHVPGGWGLYPVVYLNVEGLQVLMDRQRIFEDRRLRDALHRCERELRTSYGRILRDVLPLDLRNLWWSTLGRVRPVYAVAVLLLGSVVAAAIGVRLLVRPTLSAAGEAVEKPSGPRAVDEIEQTLHTHPSPAVTASAEGWDFRYEGPSEALFILRFLTVLDPARGFSAAPLRPRGMYPVYPDTGHGRISVRMRVRGIPSPMVVPTPIGYVVTAGSVRFDGADVRVWEGEAGEAFIALPSSGWVSYTAVPRGTYRSCDSFLADDLPWPATVRVFLAGVKEYAPEARVEAVRRFVREHFVYDRGATKGPPGSWLEEAVAGGRGDCEVINGVAAAMLRSVGVEAHVAVGLVGITGRAIGTLHAVAVYCMDGWRTLDLTQEVRAEERGNSVSVDMQPTPLPTPAAPPNDARLAPWVFSLLAVMGIAGALVERRARMARPDPAHVRSLFAHLHDPSSVGGSLRYRPAVPLIGGRAASLFQLERMASRGGLFGARPGSHAARAVRGYSLIDRSSPLTEALAPYLPPITWLDDPWWNAALPESLQLVENLLRKANDGIRIHMVPESALITGASVRFRGGGRYHAMLGENHPVTRAVAALSIRGLEGGFAAAQTVVRALPFYFHPTERFLAALDRAAPAGGKRQI